MELLFLINCRSGCPHKLDFSQEGLVQKSFTSERFFIGKAMFLLHRAWKFTDPIWRKKALDKVELHINVSEANALVSLIDNSTTNSLFVGRLWRILDSNRWFICLRQELDSSKPQNFRKVLPFLDFKRHISPNSTRLIASIRMQNSIFLLVRYSTSIFYFSIASFWIRNTIGWECQKLFLEGIPMIIQPNVCQNYSLDFSHQVLTRQVCKSRRAINNNKIISDSDDPKLRGKECRKWRLDIISLKFLHFLHRNYQTLVSGKAAKPTPFL